MHHLTVRVAWHDNRWNGAVCRAPSQNAFCLVLDRIRTERDDAKQDALALKPWSELSQDDLPPCIAESGGFMSDREWTRVFNHPYQKIEKARATHGLLRPTPVKVPPYTAIAVPFAWMLVKQQKELDASLPIPLPPDESSPFNSGWVFGRARIEAILQHFFGQLTPQKSLVFFYAKEATPISEAISRLVVGIGTITSVMPMQFYASDGDATYPLWDRLIRHSIRPDGRDGFLFPYHDYLEPTGAPAEDERRQGLLQEIAAAVEAESVSTFSYAAELATPDTALSTLVQALTIVRKIRAHGIAPGPWEQREEWLNEQIAATWQERGAFPGLGAALEALGMRLGTALSLELISSGAVASDGDPWPLVDAMLRGERQPPQPAYQADLAAVRNTWVGLSEDRRALLKLLSRFGLTKAQAVRWYDQQKRARMVQQPISDQELLANPYRLVEADLGLPDDPAISLELVDRGLLPDSTIAARHPVPAPSHVASSQDGRRIRAALVSVLRRAAEAGDTLLSEAEALERLERLNVERSFAVGSDWMGANQGLLEPVVAQLNVPQRAEEERVLASVQLGDLRRREDQLRKILNARAKAKLHSLQQDWAALLQEALRQAEKPFDASNPRHVEAAQEQVQVLERITTRKLAALVGRAGTGKTSVLGALLQCQPLTQDGVLLLAPTGKARVRLTQATTTTAMTIAQFLYSRKRYDGQRQRPLFTGEDKYRKEKTVVIDECSMLTMDDLLAVLEALDLAHVQRVILVGDPNQLPPIGAGRPFADFVGHLELALQSDDAAQTELAGALGRLSVEVRTATSGPSDTLRLASWFTRESQPSDADRVLSDLNFGESFNDLEICFWKTPEELHQRVLDQLQKHLRLQSAKDIDGFNRALGFNDKGWLPFDAPDGVENFQILSPVRMHPHGVYDLNRWIQKQFRAEELRRARDEWGTSLGNEEIVVHDKVIQVWNQRRSYFDTATNKQSDKDKPVYLANGEIGTIAREYKGWLNVVFAGRRKITVGYSSSDFSEGGGPLELAYALTVHKAQGSEFGTVFVVLPKECRLLSRELLYTALTRSRQRLVLLVEGDNASALYDLSKPESSETARRNTNLFVGAIRERIDQIPYPEHLIHRTEKGHMVRSKSELVIANMLYRMGIEYQFERVLDGTGRPRRRLPDFTFTTPDGSIILWEHLGMLQRDDYRKSWEEKRRWYEDNGYIVGQNLFTTADDERGGLDSTEVRKIAQQIEQLV